MTRSKIKAIHQKTLLIGTSSLDADATYVGVFV